MNFIDIGITVQCTLRYVTYEKECRPGCISYFRELYFKRMDSWVTPAV